jgi:microcompartment protein CcmL/EutN
LKNLVELFRKKRKEEYFTGIKMEQNKTKQKTEKAVKQRHEALAFIETKGKTGTIGALDIMPKTSDVVFVNRVNIGSGLVTAIFTGEVAAAESARMAAGDLAGKMGALVSSHVIPRPHDSIYNLIKQRSGEQIDFGASDGKKLAVGMIETDGYVSMVEAADKGVKAADVIIPGWVTVGSGLTTVFFRGEVAAVHAAVEAGAAAAEKLGKIHSLHVIPQPHMGTEEAAPIGMYAGASTSKDFGPEAALGILETNGISGLVEGIDSGLKAANISVQGWEKIGKGITSTIFRGTVADVRSAMDAAVYGAGKIGEVTGSYIIARPHKELDPGR